MLVKRTYSAAVTSFSKHASTLRRTNFLPCASAMGMLCFTSRAHLHVCFSASQRLCDVHVHSNGAVSVHAQQLQRCPLEAAFVPGKAAQDLPSHGVLTQSFIESMSARIGAHAQSAACHARPTQETPLTHNHVQLQPGGWLCTGLFMGENVLCLSCCSCRAACAVSLGHAGAALATGPSTLVTARPCDR